MKKPFLFTVFCLLITASAYAGQIQISTYYPSPFGYYERLKFNPRLALTEPCEVGTVYYLSGTGLKYCAEDTTWKNMGGSGAWTQNADDIYPIDTTTNPNLNIGIGTTTPDEELHIGQATGNVVLRLGDFGPNDWDLIRSVGVDIPSGSFALKMFGATDPSLVADTLGNIGIGTMTPLAKLHVTASDQALVMFNNPGTGFNQATIQLISDAANMIMRATSTADAGGDHKVISAEADNSTEFRLWTNWDYTTNIGTPITFFTKGVERMRIDGETGNVGIGTTTPNNRIQVQDLINFNNTSGMTALGYQAGNVNTASGNTFIGYKSGLSNTTGYSNTASGYETLYLTDTGWWNTANGYHALRFNRGGSGNTAIGTYALRVNTSGGSNTAIGYNALYNNTAHNNTAIGSNALYLNTSGTQNIAIGGNAGANITIGSKNIILGYNIDAPSATGNNQLSIGNLIFGTGLDGTGTTVSTGNIGIGTNAPATRFEVSGGAIKATGGLIIETRTDNPASPVSGQVWLCTDTGDATPCNGN